MSEVSERVDACAGAVAARVAELVNAACLQKGMLPGHRVLTIPADGGAACWCACGPQAGINPVATPAGVRPMSDLKPGDSVLAAGRALAWAPAPVCFSNGAIIDGAALIRVAFAAGGPPALTVVPDHPFLAATGRLIRARDLGAGAALALADGGAIVIAACDLVPAQRRHVWHIATTDAAPTGLDAHLLNTGGVVSGDYAVQLFFEDLTRAGLAHGAAPAA